MPIKPSSREEEYILRQEIELRRKAAKAAEERMESEERTQMKELHWMRCPKCGQELHEINFRGVRVDQCSSCEGLWLDAGELEGITASDSGKGFLGSFRSLFRD